MARKNILVALQRDPLTGVQHALALANRLTSRVFVLRITSPDAEVAEADWSEEVLRELLASAQGAGIDLSYHTADRLVAGEIQEFLRHHGISLLVLGEEPRALRRAMAGFIAAKPTLGCQIVEVRARSEQDKEP